VAYADVSRLLALIEESGFWRMPVRDDTPPSVDGAGWWVEGVREGRYHEVVRSEPIQGMLFEAGMFLLNLARLETCLAHSPMGQYKLSDLKYLDYEKTADDSEPYALIEAPDGLRERLRRGEYMGSDYGQIVEVGESHIELSDIVSVCAEGQPLWVERTNYLPIQGAVDPVRTKHHPDRVPHRGPETRCP
jgi:hypothetical protein